MSKIIMSVTGNPILSVSEKQLLPPLNHFPREVSLPCHVNADIVGESTVSTLA